MQHHFVSSSQITMFN
uniref:Uncharacterized protein n=1 Tax=Anguilla anguilla TaxID=7936 RepID=A0A0E9RTM5_ANGAN